MLAGKRCSAGFAQKIGDELFGVHRRDLVRVELAAEPFLQKGGTLERPLHGHLLVEQHPDEKCERIGVQQPIRVAVSRDCKRPLHGLTAYGSVSYSSIRTPMDAGSRRPSGLIGSAESSRKYLM